MIDNWFSLVFFPSGRLELAIAVQVWLKSSHDYSWWVIHCDVIGEKDAKFEQPAPSTLILIF